MFDDEDYDDYFLEEDEEDTASRPTSGPIDSLRPTPRAGETIDFGGSTHRTPHPEHENSTDEGCMAAMFRRLGCGCAIVILLAIIVGGAIGYFRYLTPTVEEAVMDVKILRVEKRGLVFKTYEAEVTDPHALSDVNSDNYTRMNSVSIADEEIAHRLRTLQATGRNVRVSYSQYASTLPWRGESKIIITDILNVSE